MLENMNLSDTAHFKRENIETLCVYVQMNITAEF